MQDFSGFTDGRIKTKTPGDIKFSLNEGFAKGRSSNISSLLKVQSP